MRALLPVIQNSTARWEGEAVEPHLKGGKAKKPFPHVRDTVIPSVMSTLHVFTYLILTTPCYYLDFTDGEAWKREIK